MFWQSPEKLPNEVDDVAWIDLIVVDPQPAFLSRLKCVDDDDNGGGIGDEVIIKFNFACALERSSSWPST